MALNVTIAELIGRTIVSVNSSEDEIIFTCSDGTEYMMHHIQDCCECVCVESIDGDLNDLIGFPILEASERSESDEDGSAYESATWTFYVIRNVKSSITIRWHGSSNGYYSESVDFDRIK